MSVVIIHGDDSYKCDVQSAWRCRVDGNEMTLHCHLDDMATYTCGSAVPLSGRMVMSCKWK